MSKNLTQPATERPRRNWRSLSRSDLRAAIMEILSEAAVGRSLSPPEIAKVLAADEWRRLLPTLKQTGAVLARSGELEILRKGKPVTPDAARGVVRWRLPIPAK